MKSLQKIHIPPNANIWKHELDTARALANHGYEVEFLRTSNMPRHKTPDILMDGLQWELKSPRTDKLSAIERNLKRASKQSQNIITDTHRLQRLHDASVQKLLIQKLRGQKTIQRLLLVNRKREVIDIASLI